MTGSSAFIRPSCGTPRHSADTPRRIPGSARVDVAHTPHRMLHRPGRISGRLPPKSRCPGPCRPHRADRARRNRYPARYSASWAWGRLPAGMPSHSGRRRRRSRCTPRYSSQTRYGTWVTLLADVWDISRTRRVRYRIRVGWATRLSHENLMKDHDFPVTSSPESTVCNIGNAPSRVSDGMQRGYRRMPSTAGR